MKEKFLDNKNKVLHIIIGHTTWHSAKHATSQILVEKFAETDDISHCAHTCASKVKIYQTSINQMCINFYPYLALE